MKGVASAIAFLATADISIQDTLLLDAGSIIFFLLKKIF